MKKTTRVVLLVVLMLLLFNLSGCAFLKNANAPQIIESYPSDTAPSQVIKTDDFWVMLFNSYAEHDYSILIGENPDSLNEIYNVDDVTIWYFDADNDAVVWSERSTEFYTYKLYRFDTRNVETIYQASLEDGYQAVNIGIYAKSAYYCLVDYKKQDVSVLAYNFETGSTTVVYDIPYEEKNQPHTINVEDEYLSFACADEIAVINLKNNETVFKTKLPEEVKYTYAVSYDGINDVCALYYADEDSEDIAVLKEGDAEISSLCTFSKNYYAYMEKIECYDGHLYWIKQANVSGMVADHYTFVDYDYLTHKPIETKWTLDFFRDGKEIYLIRFNKIEYTHMNLCQYQ